jgi:cytochrome P450
MNYIQSTSILSSFIMAMALYPEVQRKARAELDRVLDLDRLPTFADRNSLPYIRALCLEILRLYCPAPTGENEAKRNQYAMDSWLYYIQLFLTSQSKMMNT